ncbi:CHRD domain-containing protein [Streptomyces sp. NPDC046197]|uniref:CHRD domain-containing protein n=1 Tax=Streptomyces sp. NPDC046197 TaxID=3154337 RepID=UPI0033CAF923
MNATFSKRRKGLLVAAVAVAAIGGVAAAAVPAAAASGRHTGGGGTAKTGGTVLVASLRGANEVPVQGGPAVGDKDGAALEFIKVRGSKVSVAVTWRGTGTPTMLHIHQGAKGTNGGVKIDFSKLLGKAHRRNGHSLVGTVDVRDSALLKQLTNDPGSFYANLHTAGFPGGAVRGQLHKVTTAVDFRHALGNFQASVIKGRQIYRCEAGADGSHAFARRDVAALLGGGIRHSFVKPGSGTPRWVAPDGSAVTGVVLTKAPNGDGNIPELDLKAAPAGRHHGLLAGTAEILRLNTVGGVAPTGTCFPGTVAAVPYQADYVFVQH